MVNNRKGGSEGGREREGRREEERGREGERVGKRSNHEQAFCKLSYDCSQTRKD